LLRNKIKHSLLQKYAALVPYVHNPNPQLSSLVIIISFIVSQKFELFNIYFQTKCERRYSYKRQVPEITSHHNNEQEAAL